VARVAAAVSVPVTADLEAGYGLPAGELVERLHAAGAVGCNLEDTDHHGPDVLVPAVTHAARVAAVKGAGDVVVNARVDVFARRIGTPEEQLAAGTDRARRYLDAGADCVYPITLADEAAIASFVEAVEGPVNILARPGAPDVATLARLGVARISVGSGLFRTAMGAARAAAEALRP
jgi:2-methylisocitrate lyase-like PEP mutase family enzyme